MTDFDRRLWHDSKATGHGKITTNTDSDLRGKLIVNESVTDTVFALFVTSTSYYSGTNT